MDSFPAHAIIPSEVKATPEFEEADIPQRNRHVPRHFTATMSCSFDVGSKMDRYEHHPMWCTMFAIAEGALAMAACFPAWGRQRSGWPARRTKSSTQYRFKAGPASSRRRARR